MDPGYPKLITTYFPGIGPKIDAVFYYNSKRIGKPWKEWKSLIKILDYSVFKIREKGSKLEEKELCSSPKGHREKICHFFG